MIGAALTANSFSDMMSSNCIEMQCGTYTCGCEVVEFGFCLVIFDLISLENQIMNWLSCLAGMVTAVAAIFHIFFGSKEFKYFEPSKDDAPARQSWTQSLAGWQWVSFDLVFATIGFLVIGTTDLVKNETQMLVIASLYFAGTGIGWLMTVTVAGKSVKNRYVVLGQWALCWVVSVTAWFAARIAS